jgi:hypothetical protein
MVPPGCGISLAGWKLMSDDFLTRLRKITSEILKDEQVEVTAAGEDYYVFTASDGQGVESRFQPIWIAPEASDYQIRDKLSREFFHALNPEWEGDDLSTPGLRIEGR